MEVTMNAESVLMVVLDNLVVSVIIVGLVACTFGSTVTTGTLVVVDGTSTPGVTKVVLVIVDGPGASKLAVLVGEPKLVVIVDPPLTMVRIGGWSPAL